MSLAISPGCFSVIFAERLPVKTYTVADGLLRDTVFKIKQDSRGFLWFCTAEGISRFDGYGFTNFTVADGLPGGRVNDFLETGGGAVYIATDDGLVMLNSTGTGSADGNPQSAVRHRQAALFTRVTPKDSRARAAQVLFEDAAGTIWVGTSDGLYQLDGRGELAAVDLGVSKTAEKQIAVTAIVEDLRGALWIGTEGSGLFRRTADGKISQFTVADGLPGDNFVSLMVDRDGKLWAGMRPTTPAGLLWLNTDADTDADDAQTPIVRRAFTVADGLPSDWIPAIMQASDGRVQLGTTRGLCEWQGENGNSVCKTYTAKNDLCDKDVWSLAEDKDGNFWTGSKCGAKKIARYGFTTYGAPDGIQSAEINSIFENRRGELFAGVINDGERTIYRFADGKFLSVMPHLPSDPRYFTWGWKQTVWQDAAGAWLFPNSRGLFRFAPPTKFEDLKIAAPEKISPATKGAEVFRFYEDSHGDYWLGTVYGGNELWRWEGATNRWHDYTAQVLVEPDRIVTSFVEDNSGNLWIGTGIEDAAGGKLIRWRDGEFKTFGESDGVPDGWIWDLYIDHTGKLWLANIKHGVQRLDDVNGDKLKFSRYSTADGLSSAGAYCLTEDRYGRIYIGSARGIDRLTPETGQVENFTTADGLPSSNVKIAYRDKNDDLWFGTANGLTKYAPEPARKRLSPTVLITALRVNGEPQSVSVLGEKEIPKLDLSSEQKQISVDFVGLGANLGEKLKYEYCLGDADWTSADERTVNFANLSAGNYRFAVRAVTADRIASAPAVLTFDIAAPVYLRWWFIVLTVALTAFVIFAFYRYRLNKLLEIERTRTRIASDLHDDIGTNLSKISLLSEIVNLQIADQNVESRRLLKSIAEISRESVGSMADIVWAINPQRDSVLELIRRMRLHVEELFLDRNVRVIFNAPEYGEQLKLSMDARRELFLIFKEAVNNAAKHSDGSRIEINFRLAGGAIHLSVADDGRGFDVSKKSDGNGLENMRNRAVKNGGECTVESSAAHGTILKISFPQN